MGRAGPLVHRDHCVSGNNEADGSRTSSDGPAAILDWREAWVESPACHIPSMGEAASPFGGAGRAEGAGRSAGDGREARRAVEAGQTGRAVDRPLERVEIEPRLGNLAQQKIPQNRYPLRMPQFRRIGEISLDPRRLDVREDSHEASAVRYDEMRQNPNSQ